jgi:hypothetical protein
MVVALLALFVALSGVGIAATGGTFILGQPNTATTKTTLSAPVKGKALQLTNATQQAESTALALTVAAGHAPLTVNSAARVANLNVDTIDGVDSAVFLRSGILQTAALDTGGVLNATNTGTANGVQGVTEAAFASGVYGENTSGGGYGVAGRASGGGIGVYGDNTAGGYAGHFTQKVFVGAQLVCAGCVEASDIGAKVNNAGQLDGIDSTGLVMGAGAAVGQAVAVQPKVNLFLGPTMLGFLRLSYSCPESRSSEGGLGIRNESGGTINLFTESGGDSTDFVDLQSGSTVRLTATPTGDAFRIQAQGALGVITVEAASVHRANDCHAQAQAVRTD